MEDLLTVVLAAGKGTRMKSDKTKVLHQIAGKSMIKHVVETVKDLNSKIVSIIGYQSEMVKKSLKNYNLSFAIQENQLGTAHAVMQAKTEIKKHNGPVIVLYGDIPLLKTSTLERMINSHQKNKADLSVLTAHVENPTDYGRIVKDDKGEIAKIVEEDDANSEEKKIKEINSGVYCFDSEFLIEALDNIDCDNAQNEYYLTDTVDYINSKKGKIISVMTDDNKEIIGVNDRKGLAESEKIIRNRINEKLMESGVTIIDPSTTYIDKEVEIGRDSIIYPFTYIEKNTIIGKNTTIGPNSRLVNAKIGSNVEIKANCQIWKSEVGSSCTVGPYAYIRPGCKIANKVKVGDFVELKKAEVGKETKIPHLSYVGDAKIGEKSNIGAGTIFANYDGENKHQTEVGDSVFIGSNSTLVAPLKINSGGMTGAGSVVTKDVDENAVVLGVPARVYSKKNK